MYDLMYDLIAIGALNVDHIMPASQLASLDATIVEAFADRIEYGNEIPASETEIDEILSKLSQPSFKTCLGGSAFNVIQALVSMRLGFKLGYVGVAGTTDEQAPDFIRWFEHSKVDSRYVLKDEGRSGVCISFIRDRERSLSTFPGANTKMADFLRDNSDQIIDYLTQARIIHVTSFYDDATPDVLSWILRTAKENDRHLLISFDPGPYWVASGDNKLKEKFRQILAVTDFLFLNNKEFKNLGREYPGAQDSDLAEHIFGLSDTKALQIVVKRYSEIRIFYRLKRRIEYRTVRTNVVMPDTVEDSTGAGDVFAAGVLASQLTPGLDLDSGIELGMRLVKAKLSVAGSDNPQAYPTIVNGLINDLRGDS